MTRDLMEVLKNASKAAGNWDITGRTQVDWTENASPEIKSRARRYESRREINYGELLDMVERAERDERYERP